MHVEHLFLMIKLASFSKSAAILGSKEYARLRMPSSAVHNAAIDIIAIFCWMKILTLLSFHTKPKLFITADIYSSSIRSNISPSFKCFMSQIIRLEIFMTVQCFKYKNSIVVCCQARVQTMSRSCSGHVQVISIPSPSQISRSGPGADSIIAMPPPTTHHHQQTFLIEITQISLLAVSHKHKEGSEIHLSMVTDMDKPK